MVGGLHGKRSWGLIYHRVSDFVRQTLVGPWESDWCASECYFVAWQIMQDTSALHQVPSPVANVMMAAGLQYANPNTLSDVRGKFEEQRVASDEVEDGETQSSERIPETQFTPE